MARKQWAGPRQRWTGTRCIPLHPPSDERLLRQGKLWRGGCHELKPLVAVQRVRLPPGKGAARQPGASLAWRAATPVVKRRQQVMKRRGKPRNRKPTTPSVLTGRGQYRKRRQRRGATGRPGSWTGAESRDGPPGNLGDPALARGQDRWNGNSQREQSRPRPAAGPVRRRERPRADTNPDRRPRSRLANQ